MPSVTPELEAASIVLNGSFNPGVLHPKWLASQGAITDGEADSASELVITNEFARFDAEWLTVEALSDRLTLMTRQAPYFSPLRDLAESLLNLLPHTPIVAIGMNRSAHFKLRDEMEWHSFGHRLAPKDPLWNKILTEPGTLRLSVQGVRDDGRPGVMNVTVEPSRRVVNGFFVDINDHCQRPDDFDDTSGSSWASDVLRDEWQAHGSRVTTICASLLDFAGEEAE